MKTRKLSKVVFADDKVKKAYNYIKKYGINNLWKYDTSKAWRLLYSVVGDEITIISVILEWMPHKDYERKFRY